MKDTIVAIIGGGAAGLMAGVSVKQNTPDMKVFLFEKNAYLGAKVSISGGGRCNVTTGIFDVRELIKNYPRGGRFLMTALYSLPPEKVMAWFEEHGVSLKIEEDMRVFPRSDRGKDVVEALEKNLRAAGVEIFCRADVKEVRKKEDKFELVVLDTATKQTQTYLVDKLVITTGGNAYRHTGSTGDGYAFAQMLGHTITSLAPSLNAFTVEEKWISSCAGVSYEKATLTMGSYKRTGAFVFTHKGVSGPAVFALSSMAAYEKYSRERPLPLTINFFPDEKSASLKKRLDELLTKNPKKMLATILDFFLPKSLCAVVVSLLNTEPHLTGAHLSKELRERLIFLLQNFPLTLIGQTGGEEFVTAGGVCLDEVDTNTMASKICPGVYFAGEVLDVDGFTGGFNLQASWATGYLAGKSLSLQTLEEVPDVASR